MVGATGFEPATTCPPCRCATRLRYAPTVRGREARERWNLSNPRASAQVGSGALALQPAEDALELGLDLGERRLAVGVDESQLGLAVALLALLEQLAARPRDGE